MSVDTDSRVAQISEWLRIFIATDQITELRALDAQGGGVMAGWFEGSYLETLAREAVRLEEFSRGVYFTPNPIDPQAPVAGRDRLPLNTVAVARSGEQTKDSHILRRHWLLVDCDSSRPKDTSATEAEREAAWAVLDRCRGTLDAAGLRGAVVADSGNGWHLCLPILMPNDDGSRDMIRRVLQGLHQRCSDQNARVDTSCFNASRIWKLYGTRPRKGAPTLDRPWRYSRIVEGTPWEEAIATANVALLVRLLEHWARQDSLRKPKEGREAILARAKAYCQKEEPAISGSRGHDKCFHVVCVLVIDFVLTEEEVLEVIQEWNYRCQPPWSEKDLRHKIQDAMKRPEPRGRLLNTNGKHEANGQAEPGPAPTPEPDPWKAPIPLRRALTSVPFPLDVLPPGARCFVEECAWAVHCPPDFVAIPILTIASGAIGNSRRLAITRTHTQSASLFAFCVGNPGSGKTPALNPVTEPLEAAERQFYRDWKAAVNTWEDDDKTPEPKPEKPKLRRVVLDDCTTEAMLRILGENSRGLVMVRDELAALVAGFNQYKDGGKGNDRQVYLKIWSGAAIRVDRKSNLDAVPLWVRHPFLAIFGGIQPTVIDSLQAETRPGAATPDDGFLDRFLASYPDDLPANKETWREISKETAARWETTIKNLLEMVCDRNDEGEEKPRLVWLSPDGKMAWTHFTEVHANELNAEDFPDHLRGAWAKLRGYCGRLALVLHYLWAAYGEKLSQEVNGDDVRRAHQLTDYFKSHAQKLYTALGRDPRIAQAGRVLHYLERHRDLTVISRRDLYKDLTVSFKTPEQLEEPLKLLVEHGYLRPLSVDTKHPGRKPTPRYEINPLWSPQNRQNGQN